MTEKNTQAVARHETASPAERRVNSLIPAVDIWEDTEIVTIFANLPGVGKDGLGVHIDKDTLLISGKQTVKEETQAESDYTEMPLRDYYRVFTIGKEIDREKISAQLTNAVLKVVLPKAESAKPKKIGIHYS